MLTPTLRIEFHKTHAVISQNTAAITTKDGAEMTPTTTECGGGGEGKKRKLIL